MLNLEGAFAKLVRAYEHLTELDASIEAFGETPDMYRMRFDPHFIDTEWVACSAAEIKSLNIPKERLRRRKSDGRTVVLVPVTADVDVYAIPCVLPPVERWGLMIGDVIHNLRSALDHLIFALTCHWPPPVGKTPPDVFDFKWRRVQFPIAATDREWMDSRNGFPTLLWGLPPGLRAQVRRIQPYVTGQQPGHTPKTELLWVLQELWNTDKHRRLNLVAVALGFEYARAYLPGQRGEFLTPTVRHEPFGPLPIDAPVAVVSYRANPSPRLWKMDMQMQVRFRFDVAFDEASPAKGALVRKFLDDAFDLVARILITFENVHRDDL